MMAQTPEMIAKMLATRRERAKLRAEGKLPPAKKFPSHFGKHVFQARNIEQRAKGLPIFTNTDKQNVRRWKLDPKTVTHEQLAAELAKRGGSSRKNGANGHAHEPVPPGAEVIRFDAIPGADPALAKPKKKYYIPVAERMAQQAQAQRAPDLNVVADLIIAVAQRMTQR